MGNDIQDVLSAMLADWHYYCQHTAQRSGLPGRAPGFGSVQSSWQYDYGNNVDGDEIDKRIMQGFDAAVSRVPQPWYTALQFEAKNCAVGYVVWASPRLPTGEALEIMVLEARNKLLRELAKDGVLC